MKKITLLLILLCLSLSINAQTYLTESFDAGIPATWTIDDAGQATGDSWISGLQGGANSLNGTNVAIADSDANGDDIILFETLTSPVFDTTGATAVFLDFDQFYRNGGGDTANVEVWDGTAWVSVLTQSATVGAFNAPDEQSINLTAFSNAAMQVRFIYNDNDVWAWYWLIDNVIIYNSTCPIPENLNLVSSTDTTANLTWTTGGTETAWEIVVQTQGTGLPMGSGTSTTTNNPHIEMGLTAATNYEAYVRSDCGGDFSIWIGPLNFVTQCATFSAPYTEGFENGGSIPLCWTMDGGEDWNFNNVAPNFGHIGDNGTVTGTTITNDFFAWVDASGNDGPTTLTSPLIDVSGLTTPALSFYEISNNEGGDNAQLDVEVWDGAAWNLMATYNTNTSGWEEKVINISTLTITGDVQARFVFSEPIDDITDDIAIDDVTFGELPTCANPSTIAVDAITDTTVTLSWMANGTETAWEVVVQAAGTASPTGAGIAALTNPYVAMGLTPVTNYDAYVRADCGSDFSLWIGPINFTTECLSFVAPYTEGFDNGGAIPICWTMDGGENWNFDDEAQGFGHIGNDGVITGNTLTNGFFAWVDASGDDGPTTLTTPFVDVSGLTTPSLSFFEISNNEGGANAQLDVEVWDGAAWNLMATFNTNTSGGWEEKVLNISTLNITGDVQARFIFSEPIAGFEDDIAIDDVTFDELPECPNPSILVLDSSTDTTATLAWMANGTETAWEVVVQAPGIGTPTGSGMATTTNPYVATGLTAATNYEAYIRSDCSTEFSIWIGPLSFTTECVTFIAPYTEGFENGGTIPLCWTMSGGEDWNFNDAPAPGGHVGDNGTIIGTTLTNGFFAWVDASGDNGPTTLLSPLVDVSGLTIPALSFFEISDNEEGSNAQLDVEVWDGAAWNLMGTYNTNTVGWEEKVINISTLNITGDVQARFIFSEPLGDFTDDIAIDDVTFDELPACTNPSNLVLDSITDNTVTLSWMVNGLETAWEVVVQVPGTGVPIGTGMAAPTNPYTAMGLTAATDYEAYVRADCGTDFSDWIGPITFTTECITFIAPYSEGFENAGVIPVCWAMSGGEDWNFDDVPPAFSHIGNDGIITGSTLTNNFFAWVDASGNNGPTILLSPFVDISGLVEPALSFFEISHNEGDANAQLDVEVWDGAAWNLMGTFNTNTLGWELRILNLGSLTITGDVQARFIFSEPVTGDFSDDIAIDDVTFDELPPCLFPNTITTTNITETSVDISWLPGAGETAWEYIVQPVGTGSPTTATAGTPTTNTTVTVDMLTVQTIYEIYVRSDCNATGDGYSEWAGPIIFSTTPPNDECDTAIMFSANADGSCTNFTSGSLNGATQSSQANPCNGTANDDVWFSFVALSTDHAISLTNIVGSTTNLSHGLYEGSDCNNLTNLTCSTVDDSIANGLTIGNTYYVRIFSNNANAETTTFDLCVVSIPPPITTTLSDQINGDNDPNDDIYTVQGLVEDVLIDSPCSSISNVTSSTGINFGSDNGIGYFEANGSGFPFESGIVMTTGNVENAPGPETGTLSDGGGGAWPGDTDLAMEIGLANTNNASIIEFDFVPFIQDMSFEFIFAAEEYGNFQCGFSDAFAFLLTDTVTNVTTNIAVIPNTTTPVSVFTIRDMAFNGNCPSVNDNLFGAYYGAGGLPAISSPTNFIGRTVPLIASSTVIPNRTYHIKLVVADDQDTAFDSAVFLKAGSFEIGEVDLGEDILLSNGNANCEGEEVTLDVGVPVGDNATITWYTLENGIQEPILDDLGMPENGLTLNITETNNYVVEIVLNINASCFVIDQILVEFFPNPLLPDTLPDILGCATDNTGQAIFNLTENELLILGTQTDETVTYYENLVDAEAGTAAITNTIAYQSTPPTIIYYRIENNTTGCFKTSTFNLALAPKPILVQSDNILGCDDDEDGISNYDLTTNETVIVNSQTGFTFTYYTSLVDAETSTGGIGTPTDFDGGAQTIFVRVEDANGCFDVTTFDLEFGIAPMTSFDSAIVYEVCPNATVPITVEATGDNYTESDVTIAWYNEGVLVSGQTDLTIDNVLTSGTYTIEIMFNATGCTATQDIFVEELESCIIPQGISPNGDGMNDTFDLSSFDVQNLTIFNRNGVKVYEKTNYLDEWHGQSLDGDELPVGTYYYVMNFQSTKTKAAWVYINRENN